MCVCVFVVCVCVCVWCVCVCVLIYMCICIGLEEENSSIPRCGSAYGAKISAEVSLMMMQHLTKKGKEFAKAKLAGDLAPFDRVRDALKAAEKRPDLFKPHWCMDFQVCV